MFSHNEINATDMNISAQFYESTLKPLGFLIADWELGKYVRLTNCRDAVIVLCQTEEKYLSGVLPYHRRRVGLAHFALAVESKELVDQMEAHLASIDIPPKMTWKV